MTNDMMGGMILGSVFTFMGLGLFQWGINTGIKIAITLVENHPMALSILRETKSAAHVLPHITRQK